MFKKILRLIKKYDTIVIARHIGVDPDALASQVALRDTILLAFPNKKVMAVGNGSAKFHYMGKLDKLEIDNETLLIVLDTPDQKRVDGVDVSDFAYSIKIDHHPFVEKFCDVEYIDDKAGSTCEILLEFITSCKLKMNKEIASHLFMGIVSDTNRFLFNTATPKLFRLIANLIEEYQLDDLFSLYQNLYLRPMSEVRLQGYIGENMMITPNGVGYIKITNDLINQFGVDSASAGNMINNFNFIEEIYVWVTITEDVKNDIIRIGIRSRGPVINFVAEKYNGGGHVFASGARVTSFEKALELVNELDEVCKKYKESIKEEIPNED